jgi:hypothetical protein
LLRVAPQTSFVADVAGVAVGFGVAAAAGVVLAGCAINRVALTAAMAIDNVGKVRFTSVLFFRARPAGLQ